MGIISKPKWHQAFPEHHIIAALEFIELVNSIEKSGSELSIERSADLQTVVIGHTSSVDTVSSLLRWRKNNGIGIIETKHSVQFAVLNPWFTAVNAS